MTQKRTQLTLFADPKDTATIERIRREFNPEQFALIAAHVTLCREDELENLGQVLQNLENLQFPRLTLFFEKIIRFSDGKGVLLPAAGDNEVFQNLRKAVLAGLVEQPRRHEAHLTLMHPRNSTCTDLIFEKLLEMDFPRKIEFRKISLIEQENEGKWQVLQEFELKI